MKYFFITIALILSIKAHAQYTNGIMRAACIKISKVVTEKQDQRHPNIIKDSCYAKRMANILEHSGVHERMLAIAKSDTFEAVCISVLEKKQSEIQLRGELRKQYRECMIYFIRKINRFPRYTDRLKTEGVSVQTINALSKIADRFSRQRAREGKTRN